MREVLSLHDILKLETVEVDLYRGYSPAATFSASRIYGGQVVAQALLAAYGTVEARTCHSLHGYFLRPGDPRIPVLYEVERARDGQSFCTRRVTAVQRGAQIFNMSVSFQATEDGLDHQFEAPPTPLAETLSDEREERKLAAEHLPPALGEMLQRARPIVIRRLDPQPWINPPPTEPRQRVWMRARERFQADDLIMQQAVLAYASDMMLLSTSLLPHGTNWIDPRLQMASLDHALWFHRPTDMNQWTLYDLDSPSASGARGFTRGSIFSASGTLVASVTQEGLIRLRSRGQ
jgi:acyl-CoA thioesterase-2